jgi:hypothetical protein
MLNLTRSKLIQMWFVAVVLVVVACFVAGVTMEVSTGLMLLALSLAPPIMVLMLWPGTQPPTVGEVLRGVDRRT